MTTGQIDCRFRALLLVTLCLAGTLAAPPQADAQQASPGYERAYRYPYPAPALTESVRDALWREWLFGEERHLPAWSLVPLNPEVGPRHTPARLMPGVVQSEVVVPPSQRPAVRALGVLPLPPPPSPPPDLKLDGISGSSVPDSGLAAGPTHLVSAVNSHLQFFTLAGDALATLSFNSFFPTEPTRFIFDPRVCYDENAGRFILVAVGRRMQAPQASTFVIAVSATSDPTGVWHKYVLDMGRNGSPPTEWADYPSLGYDGTAIYISFNMFTFQPETFMGNRLLILAKSRVMSGQSLMGSWLIDNVFLPSPPFSQGATAGTLKPVESVGPITPALMISSAVSTAGVIGLALYKIADPLGSPRISVSFIDTTDFPAAGEAPQAGSNTPLHTHGARLHKSVYRAPVVWTCLAASSTGAQGGKAQVIFFKIDPQGSGALLDVDVLVHPSVHFFYPAIMPTAAGDAIAVFGGSDATRLPSIYVARYSGATGTFEAPLLIESGMSHYDIVGGSGRNRWGDYQDAALDVASGTHVWVQGMIPIGPDLWQLRAAKIAASAPLPPGGLTATAVSNARIDLAWTDNSAGESGFKILRKTGDGDFSLIAVVGPDITRYSDTNLTAATAYTYRVHSFTAAGDSAPSNDASATRPVGVALLTVAPNPVQGGNAVTGIVTLDGPAGPGDLSVTLSSSNRAVASPATGTVTIPAGSSSQVFTANTTAVNTLTPATLTATLNNVSRSVTLNVRP